MKNITVSVDDETYRQARIIAAERGTSVSAIVREFLGNLSMEKNQPPKSKLKEIIAAIHARGGGVDPSENLSREELYDRNALR